MPAFPGATIALELFSYYVNECLVLIINSSARKHGISDADIEHAIAWGFYQRILEEEIPRRVLHIGPDSSGLPLEIITLHFDDSTTVVIHAMKVTQQYQWILREHAK